MVRAPYGYLGGHGFESRRRCFCLTIAIFRTFHFSNFQNFRFKSSNIWVSYSNKWVLNWCMFLSFFSLENTLQVALGKCLGTAGTLRLPLVMPYRCIAPGEKESVNFTLKYNSSKGPQGKPCVLDDWIVFASSSCGNSQLALFRVFFHNSPSFTLALTCDQASLYTRIDKESPG